MESHLIARPMSVLFGPTLVELGYYLCFFAREHGVPEMRSDAVRALLAAARPESTRDAVLAAGATAWRGVRSRWLMLAVGEASQSESEEWSTTTLLEQLAGDVPDAAFEIGMAERNPSVRAVPPANVVSRRIYASKERVFGTGMARDLTIMLAFHRLSDVWGDRGRTVFEATPLPRWDESSWFSTARQQVRQVQGEPSLRRLVWIAGLPVALAISLAFDTMEIQARKRPGTVDPVGDAVAVAQSGMRRLGRLVAWSTVIALADDRRRGPPRAAL